jgi:hypothetical protein
MRDNLQKLIRHINRKAWWHVRPADPSVYKKRGKFFASSFKEAEFYGRPSDVPEKVIVASPVVGDNDTIERKLMGRVESDPSVNILKRFALDAKLRRAALLKGYDSILLMSETGFQEFKKKGKIPRSIELNVVDLRCLSANVSIDKTRRHRGQTPPNHSSLPKTTRKTSDGFAQ